MATPPVQSAADRVDTAVLSVTDPAREIVASVLAEESDPESLALWLEVSGQAAGAYQYDLYFQAKADARPEDHVWSAGELTVVVPASSVELLQGARLDVSDDGGERGLVVVNPNTPPEQAGHVAELDLEDPFVLRVVTVLDEQVNPAIASHGGRADLVGVDGTDVLLRLSGGCQGCGMAKATLTQGIEVLLRESIPEITQIIDVTDHATGANPYYQPA